ncbi:MAG: hypothetical protein FWD16_08135 [Clostridia bacterium]|nr:hypothetical protein [Clostridia bacterium]
MKKILTLSLTVLLMLATLLTLASCGSLGGGGGGSGGEFKYSKEFVAQNLTGDYSITYKTTNYENGQAGDPTFSTTVRTSNGYYYETADKDGNKSGILYVLHDDKYVMYQGSIEEGFTKPENLEYTLQLTQEEIENGYSGFGLFNFMTNYSDWSSMMKADGTETIAGRKCDKFRAGISFMGAGIQNLYSVDQQTGICMRYALAATAKGESGAYEFECTDFQIGGVKLPAYS